jgi:hypothetical protein
MSIKFVSAHTVAPGDTAESIVGQYRLSSWLAVTDMPANEASRPVLLSQGDLPPGLQLSIPPNAAHLARERLQLLHRIMPKFNAHFAELRGYSESALQSAVLAARNPAESATVATELANLRDRVAESVRLLAHAAEPLVGICQGMAHTHMAQSMDHAAVQAAGDSLCGLYGAISPPRLQLWQNMWAEDVWADKWCDEEPQSAWQLATQYLTTVQSLVVQHLDQRLRETQAMERKLQSEAGP